VRIAEIAPVWLSVPPVGYGGIELVVSLLADGLTDRGHDVTLFASGGSRTSGRLVSPVENPPGFESPEGSGLDMLHALESYRYANQFDVIHDHTVLGPILAAQMATRPPVVHTLHGPWHDTARRLYAMLDDQIALVAISEDQRRGNPSLRYAGTVPNGLDLSQYPFRETKENFLLFVGRANPDKAPEAALGVARRTGRPIVLVVKREEEAERAHWARSVEPLLRRDDVVMGGVSHEVKVDLMSRAAGLLMPIRWAEPFGLVMIEAMACGTPVIAAPMGAAVEIVEDGVTGFLRAETADMASAVEDLGDLSPRACRDRVRRHFDVGQMVTGYERIFEEVASAGA
jgi:glycosyltransferase involved in cell wall biosynthesis